MAAKTGKTGRGAGLQRLALIGFGAIFVLLFVGFAVAQGIGRASVPEGDVAIVEEGPPGENTISEKELKRAIVQQAAQGGLKKPPKEGSTRFEELKASALGELLNLIWVQAAAEELGLTATKKQLADGLEEIKEQNFPTPGSFAEFLETSKFTQADVDRRVRQQVLSNQITETLQNQAGAPTDSEIADYYEAAKATEFTTEASRDIRLVANKDKPEVEAAKTALEEDNSPANWKKVTQKYSTDATTKAKGGLSKGLTEQLLGSAGKLKDAIFDAATNELIGPVKFRGEWFVIEVVELTPRKVQTLDEVRAQISQTLQQQAGEERVEEFVNDLQGKWRERTICASGFVVQQCSNFKGDGRPATADPACYEADPKTPTRECPAPVTPTQPAMPGSVTILEPNGEQRVQRPVPVPAAEGVGEEVPPGVEATPGE